MWIDGELSARDAERVDAHLAACWNCRARKQDLETSIGRFVHLREHELNPELPRADGPRALLKTRLAELSSQRDASSAWMGMAWLAPHKGLLERIAAGLVASCLCLFAVVMVMKQRESNAPAVFVPNARLTPGATVLAGRQEVCTAAAPKNRMVPVSLRKQVLEEYGVGNAEPRAYEVDYLITPALGGADDIRNLWPQSYSGNGWNARVKDALEDRMHEMVCEGQLDLTTAQREISTDWIGAYKKYFHTDRPLETARP